MADEPTPDAGMSPDPPTRKAVTIKLEFADEPDASIGQSLGRYRILECIGEGGCGVVYVAEQSEPVRRRVALKVIKLGMDTKSVVARFEAERQALAMMDHPNIARVLDAGATDTGRPFFVMELVRGIRITDYCDQNHLTPKLRLDLFTKVCQAIQHAHQKGIIHRDIKPSNILVTLHDGVPVPKVIDFGIAKATDGRLTDATVYTQLHQFIGTPAYMSPEQAEMSGLDSDTRSDIYSLGVLLYELLTGRTPFDEKELMAGGIDAMRKTVREKEPDCPSTRLTSLGKEDLTTTAQRRSTEAARLSHLLRGDLDWIVMKCLEKDRTRRYETANALASDIQRYLNSEPIVARPPSTVYQLQKAFRRHQLVFTAGAVVAFALVLALVLSILALDRARQGESAAKLARNKETIEHQRADHEAQRAIESEKHARRLLYASDINLAQQALNGNNLGQARRLLDRHKPTPGEEDLRNWEWRYLWQQTRGMALATLTNRSVGGMDLSFSPDGTRLAVGWGDGRAELWDTTTRRLLRVLAEGGHAVAAKVAFSPIRNLVVVASGTNAVVLHDLDSDNEKALNADGVSGLWTAQNLAFSADGERLIVYAGSITEQKDQIWVLDWAAEKVEHIQPTTFSLLSTFGAARLSPDRQLLYYSESQFTEFSYKIKCVKVADGSAVWESSRERDSGLSALEVSPDGKWIATASGFEDASIRIWDSSNGRLVKKLDGHTGWVSRLAFSADGQFLVSGASDQTIRFWDTQTWTESRLLRGHTDEIKALAVSPKTHLIATSSKNGDLMLWLANGEMADPSYSRSGDDTGKLGVVPLAPASLVLFNDPGTPRILDPISPRRTNLWSEFGTAVNYVSFGPSNLFCRWLGKDRLFLDRWDGKAFVRQSEFTMATSNHPIYAIIQGNGQRVVWAELLKPNSIYWASQSDPSNRRELTNGISNGLPMAISQDGESVAVVSPAFDNMGIWKLNSQKSLLMVSTPPSQTLAVPVFARNGHVLAVPMLARDLESHEVQLFDLDNPSAEPRRFPGRHLVKTLAVSPDGNLIAASTDGGLIRLFDAVDLKWIDDLHGHLNAAIVVAFSANGRRLLSSCGGREAVKVWDTETHLELLNLRGVGSLLQFAYWSPDGNAILAGPPGQIWRAPSLTADK